MLILLSCSAWSTPSSASSQTPEARHASHLIELGREFYQVGRYEEAWHEFHKALLVDQNNSKALYYVHLLSKLGVDVGPGAIADTKASAPAAASREQAIEQALRDVLVEQSLQRLESAQPSEAPQLRLPGTPEGLVTYEIPKSEEELQAEAAQQQLMEQIARRREEGEPESADIPYAARPAVKLRGTVSYSYSDPHAAPPTRQLRTRVGGQAFDVGVDFEDVRRDLSGLFQHDYTYLNLTKPGLFIGMLDQATSLSPLRTQVEGFYGLKVIKDWDDILRTTYAVGNTENTVSGTEGSVKYLGHLYQASGEFRPAQWVRLHSGLFYLTNEADLPERSGTSDFPRLNVVPFSGLELDLLQDLSLSAYAARSLYRPDNDTEQRVDDWNWRVATVWDKERYRLRYDYEFVGDRYASLGNPDTYQDFKGWNLSGDYRLSDQWSVASSLRRYRNNVDERSDATTNESQAFSLSSSYRLAEDQTLSLGFTQTISNPSGPNAGSSGKLWQYRADYFRPFLFDTRALASYQYSRNEVPAGSDAVSHSVGGSLFGTLGRGSTWRLRHDLVKTFRELEADNLNLNTALDLDYRLWPGLSLFSSSSYARDLTNEKENADTASLSTGLRYEMDQDTSMRVEYRLGSYNLDTEHRWPRIWSISFFVTKAFGFSTQPLFGAVEGWVFQDANANGIRDTGEAGVEGLPIRLKGKKTAVTDASGQFRFFRVVPGRQELQVEMADLDPTFALKEPRRLLDIKRRKTARVEFPVVQAASISGRVFIDDNGDQVFQDTEEPLEDIAVVLLPMEQFSRTDEGGVFRLEYLFPGAYTLRVHVDDLPSGYELVSEAERTLDLAPGDVRQEVDFAVRLIPAE